MRFSWGNPYLGKVRLIFSATGSRDKGRVLLRFRLPQVGVGRWEEL